MVAELDHTWININSIHFKQVQTTKNTSGMASKQTSGSANTSGRCTLCNTETAKTCSGCLGAPVYDEATASRTPYCSPKCQREDWGRHKTECKQLQVRKSLRRAATVLKENLRQIRKNAYPLYGNVDRQDNGKIIVDTPDADKSNPSTHLQPFPEIPGDDQGRLDAVLLHCKGAEAMVYLCNLSRGLFDGT